MNEIALKEFPFSIELRIRYSETDSQGLLFNANYLNLVDVAITEFFRFKSVDYKTIIETYRIDFHVIETKIKYFKPIYFDDLIQIYVRPIINKYKINWLFYFIKEGILLTQVELDYIIMSLVNQKPSQLPVEIQEKLEAYSTN
jgi:acyl-CoA thioester hydrolase